ncbi:hypothetical protein KSP40_PGU018035 [Platanthera guangdongensis]|uniref:Transposase n=1 Tax=Platanthera guangdongensis TaxID=2320717 RepID=A0ABR2MEL3_9ASPA
MILCLRTYLEIAETGAFWFWEPWCMLLWRVVKLVLSSQIAKSVYIESVQLETVEGLDLATVQGFSLRRRPWRGKYVERAKGSPAVGDPRRRYRIQSDRKIAMCSVHPTEQATLQCLGCLKSKIPVSKSIIARLCAVYDCRSTRPRRNPAGSHKDKPAARQSGVHDDQSSNSGSRGRGSASPSSSNSSAKHAGRRCKLPKDAGRSTHILDVSEDLLLGKLDIDDDYIDDELDPAMKEELDKSAKLKFVCFVCVFIEKFLL